MGWRHYDSSFIHYKYTCVFHQHEKLLMFANNISCCVVVVATQYVAITFLILLLYYICIFDGKITLYCLCYCFIVRHCS